MVTITISIDVQNPAEVVKQKKGFFTGMLAGLFVGEKKLKKEVESKICQQIVLQLKEKINEGLEKEGVIAEINYAIVADQEVEIV